MFIRRLTETLVFLLGWTAVSAQRFYPDDPIQRDTDNLPIEKPALVELSPLFDTVENFFGSEAQGPLLTAENINTLGQVPDSSWFTNRIGVREMTIEELVRGADLSGGPDTSHLTVHSAALTGLTDGITVLDTRGDKYYLIFDRKGHPNLATGAGIISNKFFHAIGFSVFGASLVHIDPSELEISSGAVILRLGLSEAPLTREFLDLFFDEVQAGADGKYRAVAYQYPPGEVMGEFKFFGTRSDDPNDVIMHENRRELRGLRVFSAWLNHYMSRSINTSDILVTEGGRSFLRHYLVDFTPSLGSGYDLDDRIVPKDPTGGFEYNFWGDPGASLKTALTLGVWKRPWLRIDYPYPELAEIGRIQGDYFEPEEWKPNYPNAAFDRMLPDDAFWAARIVARFSDQAIRAVVETAEYSNPAAADFLVEALVKRRDKIVEHYYRRVNPLGGFEVDEGTLRFQNLGAEWGLADDSQYEYEWFSFENATETSERLTAPQMSKDTQIFLPKALAEYLMVRIRTRSRQQRGWRKNVDVYLRLGPDPEVVGISREVGVFVLARSPEGGMIVRSDIEFGGTYRGLEVEQRRLIDDWYGRLAQALQREVEPEVGYDNLPLSGRSTFEGVTHALMESVLTDESGTGLGTAFDLVERVDTVRGRIRGAGGDQQFRMYVALTTGARDILDESQQFSRKSDNTIYHKGYPLNYRQGGGVPSIQFSISEDSRFADIDVDYRSSKFPDSLFNGHLTASNSDVRAGDNHNRHVGRWEGFDNWWHGIFGVPLIGDLFTQLDPEEHPIPIRPSSKKEKLEEAVDDFLTTWLVKQRPQEAIGYLTPEAYSCMDIWEDGEVDRGIAPFVLLDRMNALSLASENVRRLEDVLTPLPLTEARLEHVAVERPRQFRLYGLPNSLAEKLICSRRDDLELDPGRSRADRRGEYFASSFRLVASGESGSMLLLWRKENSYWRIISYLTEPEQISGILDQHVAPQVVQKTGEADPSFLAANAAFLSELADGNVDRALEFFSEDSMGCAGFYMDTEMAGKGAETRDSLRKELAVVSKRLGEAEDLGDIVEAAEIVHPDIRIVPHAESRDFTIGSLPDHLAEDFMCARLESNIDFTEPSSFSYGNYFATAIRLDLVGEDPSVLYLIWGREGEGWKIVAFHVLQP